MERVNSKRKEEKESTHIPEGWTPELLARAKSITAKRAKTVIDHILKHGHFVGNEKTAAELSELASILKRLREDLYLEKRFDKFHSKRRGISYTDRQAKALNKLHEEKEALIQKDLRRLNTLFRTKLRTWWD